MDTLLIKLLILRFKGGVRQRVQELKSLRGLLFLLVTIAVIVLIIKQSAVSPNLLESSLAESTVQHRGQIAELMPIGLLAAFLLTVFTSSGSAIYFSPCEINLLFSGPFTRHALLLYKMCFYVFGALLSSLLIMLLIPTFTYSPLTAFLGSFLSLMFIRLFSAAIRLLGQSVGRLLNLPIAYIYIVIPLFALVVALDWYFSGSSAPLSLTDALTQFQASTVGTLMLAPFDVFVQIFLAQSIFPNLLGWAMIGLSLNVAFLVIIIFLDNHSYETSIVASLKKNKRWKRTRRSGLIWAEQPIVVSSFKQPPVLGGIGPVIWRQLLTALRSSRKVLLVFLAVALFAGPLLVIASAEISVWSLSSGVFFVAVFVLPRTLVFDFRSDLDIMENLKALPLAPWKICIGQLLTPVLLSSLIELVMLLGAAILLGGTIRIILLSIIPFLIPFNILLYGLENLFYLLFPAPLIPVGRVDFDFLGRTMVQFTVTATLLIGGCFLAAYAGLVAFNTMNCPWPASVSVAWLSLTLIALLVLPLLSWAFNFFNVSSN